MNAVVRFPDAESRRAAFELLGADAAIGAEGWNGRHVVLSDRAVHQLGNAQIRFHIVEWLKMPERADTAPGNDPVNSRGPRLSVEALFEVVDETDAAIGRLAKGWIEDVYRASRRWKVNLSRGEWGLAQFMSPEGCFVAWRGDSVVGVITTIQHHCADGLLGWIGEFHVRPQELLGRMQTSLFDHALRHLEREVAVIEAHVDELLVPMFERRGFCVAGRINRWRQRRNTIPVQLHPSVSGYEARDIAKIAVLDQRAVGFLRGYALYDLPNAIPDLPLVYRRGEAVLGHGCARTGEFWGRIGPVVSEHSMGARLLIRTLLQKVRDRPLVWDIPDANGDANTLAEEFGFHPVEPLLVMRKGTRSVSEEGWVYATGGPLIG